MRILLVDDDVDLLDVTAYALRREGFDLISASDGAHALRRWREDEPDMVVLDLGLPHLSGIEVCQKIRQGSAVPVIFLTGRHDDESVIQGYRAGADDYVTKPFSPRQLAMRIRAIWRRVAAANEAETAPQLHVKQLDLTLDVTSHEVRIGGRVNRLTPLEFRILHLLATNAGRVVGTERLIEYAWGYTGGDSAVLRTHLSHIRRKLGVSRGCPGYIGAVNATGYRLTLRPDDHARP